MTSDNRQHANSSRDNPAAVCNILDTEVASISRDNYTYGFIGRTLQNPDRVLNSESGEGIRLYDRLLDDPHIYSVLQTRKLAVVNRDWDIEPASGADRDKEIALFVKKVLVNSNFRRTQEGLLSAVSHGFAVCEVIWNISNNMIIIDKFIGRAQHRFTFDTDSRLRLLTKEQPLEGELLPDRKFIIHTFADSSENPFGNGLGSKLYWPWWFKKHGIKFWMIFAEKFGMPTVIGWHPPGLAVEEKRKLLDVIKSIQNETGITISEGMKIELLEATRSGSIETYDKLCDFMNAQISKAVLGQTLTTEIGRNGGAYAASSVHNEIRNDLMKADSALLSETVNKTVVRWITDLNFSGTNDYPRFFYVEKTIL